MRHPRDGRGGSGGGTGEPLGMRLEGRRGPLRKFIFGEAGDGGKLSLELMYFGGLPGAWRPLPRLSDEKKLETKIKTPSATQGRHSWAPGSLAAFCSVRVTVCPSAVPADVVRYAVRGLRPRQPLTGGFFCHPYLQRRWVTLE